MPLEGLQEENKELYPSSDSPGKMTCFTRTERYMYSIYTHTQIYITHSLDTEEKKRDLC